jgi:hypothetical protein
MTERPGEPSEDAEDDRQPIIEPSIGERPRSAEEASGDALSDDPETGPDVSPLLTLEPAATENSGENQSPSKDSNEQDSLAPLLGTIEKAECPGDIPGFFDPRSEAQGSRGMSGGHSRLFRSLERSAGVARNVRGTFQAFSIPSEARARSASPSNIPAILDSAQRGEGRRIYGTILPSALPGGV